MKVDVFEIKTGENEADLRMDGKYAEVKFKES